MDVNCLQCNEPWDVLEIIDDVLGNKVPKLNFYDTCKIEDFVLQFYLGQSEIEHFVILRCPNCRNKR